MSDYIMDLRKAVGHRCLIQPGASVLLEDRKGRLLLELREDCRQWGYPGGSVEIDERVEDAARRELKEETGLTAESLELFCQISGPEMHYVYPNQDEVSNIDTVFLCTSYSGTPIPQKGEVLELRFFAPEELPEEIFPPNLPAIRQWKANRARKRIPDYALMAEQTRAFAEEERWYSALLSNLSALIYQELPDLNWAGFYLRREDELILGPFQGKPACIRIPFGKGVCGTAAAEDRTIVVPDVHQFPGHIACDSESNSEIVIPLRKEGRVIGVMDLDSPMLDRFSEGDREGLEQIAREAEKAVL